jgi:hypothetical protein
LNEKIGGMSDALDKAEPKIKSIVEHLAKLYEGLVNFASDKAGPAIENIYKYRDAIAALAAVVGTGIVASKIMWIGVALGLVTGGTAAAVTAIAAALAGVAVGSERLGSKLQSTSDVFLDFHGNGLAGTAMMDNFNQKAVTLTGTLDQLLAKQGVVAMTPFDPSRNSSIRKSSRMRSISATRPLWTRDTSIRTSLFWMNAACAK